MADLFKVYLFLNYLESGAGLVSPKLQPRIERTALRIGSHSAIGTGFITPKSKHKTKLINLLHIPFCFIFCDHLRK